MGFTSTPPPYLSPATICWDVLSTPRTTCSKKRYARRRRRVDLQFRDFCLTAQSARRVSCRKRVNNRHSVIIVHQLVVSIVVDLMLFMTRGFTAELLRTGRRNGPPGRGCSSTTPRTRTRRSSKTETGSPSKCAPRRRTPRTERCLFGTTTFRIRSAS